MSQETADLLKATGKGHWVKARQDPVTAKGKGTLHTFWLDLLEVKGNYGGTSSSSSGGQQSDGAERELRTLPLPQAVTESSKLNRLIDWQVDMFVSLLKQVVARRGRVSSSSASRRDAMNLQWKPEPGKICLDEVQEIIKLPAFDARASRQKEDPSKIDLGADVTAQLRNFITTIARLYRPNHFHNFAHACHVTMSVKKLLSRIVAPEHVENVALLEEQDERRLQGKIASSLHDHTYGITSDPLTQLAIVFSALIHDVDHLGVPNTTLVDENTTLASKYRNKSVAEQNSIDIAWDLLQEEQFKELRSCIYSTKSEFDRFRQLVVQVRIR